MRIQARLRPAILLPLAFLVCLAQVAGAEEPLRRVRIETQDARTHAIVLEQRGFDLLRGSVTDSSMELIVSIAELDRLRQLGFQAEVIEVGRPFREIQRERLGREDVPPGYPDLAQLIDIMSAAAAAYPEICQFVDLTLALDAPPTVEGRHLFAVKISDNVNVDEDEPAALMVSAHHSRELSSVVMGLYAIEELTTRYGIDPAITAAVDANEIWITPIWNPDGYNWVFTMDNMWRKNRRVFATDIGVDQNRNYPLGWDGPCTGSTDPGSQTYKGPSPASEAETQTMMAWSEEQRFAKVLDFHNHGREALHGFACWSYPFDDYLRDEAISFATECGYGGSVRPPSSEGEHFEWQFGMQGALAFLLEMHDDFQPTYSSALAEAALVWPGALGLLADPIPLWGYVTEAGSETPVAATLNYVGHPFANGEENKSGGPQGRYHAFLPAGSYDILFEAEGYTSELVTGIVVTAGGSARQDVSMHRDLTSLAQVESMAEEDRLLAVSNSSAPTLRFRIGAPTRTELRIFDVKGSLVRSLLSGHHQPGIYESVWDGRDDRGGQVASGIYFARLKTDRMANGRKVLLVK
jgi:carboxypeptidase T